MRIAAKIFLYIAAVLSVATLVPPANAADIKVGVVNLQRILQEAPQVEEVKARLQKEFAPQQQAIKAKQKELQEVEHKLGDASVTLSDSEREELQLRASTLQHDAQQLRNDFIDDLNLRRNQELGKLQRMVLQEVNNYAEENGFDLVIGDGVFYASQRINITDEIIERLNQEYKKAGKSGKGK